MSRPADVTLVVLAGGEGRRMGRPKAELRIDGQLILERLIDRLSWIGPTLLVTAPGREHPPGAARFDREVIDEVAGDGPLRGILTALENVQTPIAMIVPLDMPNVTRGMLEWMSRELTNDPDASALMLQRDGEVESLPAVVRGSMALPIVRARLAAQRRSIRALCDDPNVRLKPVPTDWPADVWINLNSPEDLMTHV